MKYLSSYVFRAVCSLILGILLICNPEETTKGITLVTGFFFVISGIISCASYYNTVRAGGIKLATGETRKPIFPIVGLGSILFGAVMIFNPALFISWMMYIFGGILIIGAINEFVILTRLYKMVHLSALFWILPSVVLASGLFVIFKPMDAASLPFLILGWCLLLYGVTEVINAIKVYTVKKNIKRIHDESIIENDFSEAEEAAEEENR